MEQFLILIIEPEWDADAATQADWDAEMALHNAFSQAVRDSGGEVVEGNALAGNSAAVRVRPGKNGSKTVITDGPFLETKEIVSGYYVISVTDVAEATRLAELCPTGGYLEVHPIFDVSTMTS